MLVDLLLVMLGVALLYGGAEWLVGGASGLALRLGLSPLIVGLTVVAFGTSAPELVVSVQAALDGAGGIAVGNVVGSNVANIGLILGVSALIRPVVVDRKLIGLDLPLMLVVTVVAVGLLFDGLLGRLEGAALLAGLLAYIGYNLREARRHPLPPADIEPVEVPPGSVRGDLLRVVLGLGVLVLGARWLVAGAVDLAEALAIPSTIIGLTVVAVGTSLPELATSLVAAARGQSDLAIGNVVGSNLFNLLGILGVASLVRPLSAPGLSMVDLAVMTGLAAVLLPLAWSRSLTRIEGALLLVVYAGYIAALALRG